MYLFLSGWTSELRGYTWSHGPWMGETDPVSPPWTLPPKWAGPWTFQLQLEIRVITFSGGTQTTCPSSTVSPSSVEEHTNPHLKIQNSQQEYSKVFCLSVFLQKSPLWTSHQSPDEQKRPAVWQRQERMVCGAICFGGHPKSCVWAILSYPTIPFQECTSLLFTQWAIYCPSLGWHFFFPLLQLSNLFLSSPSFLMNPSHKQAPVAPIQGSWLHLAVIAAKAEVGAGWKHIVLGVIGEDLPLLTCNTLVSVNIWQPSND